MAAHATPQWRNANSAGKYPFATSATLRNDDVFLPETTFDDARVHVIGGGPDARITSIVRAAETVTFYVGDSSNLSRCSGSFTIGSDTELIGLTDAYGRPAGVLVSTPTKLATFSGWTVGTFEFDLDAFPFCATVVAPVAEGNVRSVRGDDDALLTNRVALVGGRGVVLQTDTDGDGNPIVVVSAVGDRYARFSVCGVGEDEPTPSYITSVNGHRSEHGDYKLLPNDMEAKLPDGEYAKESIVRVETRPARLKVYLTGGVG
jgi:hypothetical protein